MIECLPLIIKYTTGPSFVTELELSVDGQIKFFLLDTGAASSALALDFQTDTFLAVAAIEFRGASGQPITSHTVKIKNLKLGKHLFLKDVIKIIDRNILGLDLLAEFIFQIDFRNKKICLLSQLPFNSENRIRKLVSGHAVIPVNLQNLQSEALFDTGADTTVIDLEFIENNPSLFKWIRKENGTDVTGHIIESDIYACENLQVGQLKLNKVEMATFNFSPLMKEKMEGCPIILGNNVIAKAKWSIDLKNEKWLMESYLV